MTRTRRSERGEGQVGCLVTVLVLGLLGMVTWKVLPPYLDHSKLEQTMKEAGGSAGIKTEKDILQELVRKARELEIPEAQEPGVFTVSKSGKDTEGNVTLTVRYQRQVDLYGVTTLKLDFDKRMTVPYVDATR